MTHAEYLAALPPIDPEWLTIIEDEMRGDWDEPHEAPDGHWDTVFAEVERRLDRAYPHDDEARAIFWSMAR